MDSAAKMASSHSNGARAQNLAASTTTMQRATIAQPVERAITSGSSFAQFPHLPTEVQLLIFGSAAADIRSRLVRVDVSFERRNGETHPIFKSNTRLPGLLQACRAARQVVEKKYKYDAVIESAGGGVIRLDGKRDRLLLFETLFKWVNSNGIWDEWIPADY